MRRLLILGLLLASAAPPAFAQGDVERRVDRIEREINALQRRVFPNASQESDYFQPDIQPNQQTTLPGAPASSPITDLTDRVNALERQVQNLTGQVEQNSYQLRQLQSSVEALQQQAIAAPPEGEGPGFGDTGSYGDNYGRTPTEDPDTGAPTTVRPPRTPPPEIDGTTESDTSAEAAPETPFTQSEEPPLPDDAGEASYVRGYRLWRDGNYEAARTQLQQTIEQYPGNRFESYARNLLGRAYLDDNKPANATEIFVRNYQELPNGDRAADSLFFLGVALTRLNYNERACLAFDELQDVYGAELRSTIAEQVPGAREAAGCR